MGIYAIIIGREGSKGYPGKNTVKINGMPLMAYPIMAAHGSKYVDEIYFSTESRKLKYIAEDHGAIVIDRPKELATDAALSDDVWAHAWNWILDNAPINTWGDDISLLEDVVRNLKLKQIEFLILMFANAPCIASYMIDEMSERLREGTYYDSICTISKYNMYNPIRMRVSKEVKLNEGNMSNWVLPYVPDILKGSTCDRDSSEDSYIYDCSCAVVRPNCIEDIEEGQLPQRWLGKNILGYKQTIPALDIDFEWQKFQVEYWLKRNWI